MNLLGNIIWLVFGGLAIAVEYFIGGLVLCLTASRSGCRRSKWDC